MHLVDGEIGARTVDNLRLYSATQAKVLCYDLHGLHLDLSSRTKYERHERTHQLLRLKAHLNGAAACVPELERRRVDVSMALKIAKIDALQDVQMGETARAPLPLRRAR